MRKPLTRVFRRAGCGKSARPVRRGESGPHRKVSPSLLLYRLKILLPWPLEEQILPPLRLALSKHAHQVAAGVQAEGLGLACQFHAGFFGSAAALPVIAPVAASNQVFPG